MQSIVLCKKIHTVLIHADSVTLCIFRKLLMEALGQSELELT